MFSDKETVTYCFPINRHKLAIDHRLGYESTAREEQRQSWPYLYIQVPASDNHLEKALTLVSETNLCLSEQFPISDSVKLAELIPFLERLGWQIHDDMIGKQSVPLQNIIAKPQKPKRGRRLRKWHQLEVVQYNGDTGKSEEFQKTRIGKVSQKPVQAISGHYTAEEQLSQERRLTVADEIIAELCGNTGLQEYSQEKFEQQQEQQRREKKAAVPLGDFPVETAVKICKQINNCYKVKPVAVNVEGNNREDKKQRVYVPATTPHKTRKNIRRWIKRNFN